MGGIVINSSDKIVVYPVEDLDAEIRRGINTVLAHLENRYGAPPPGKIRRRSPHGFQYLFSETNIRLDCRFGESFLETALAFSALPSRNEGLSHLLNRFDENLNGIRLPASAISYVKQGIRLLLVELWNQKAILLPTIFSAGQHFEPIPIFREIYTFIKTLNPKNSLNGIRSEDAWRLYWYMPRALFSASWESIEDVNIHELAELQRAQRLFMMGKSSTPIVTSLVPWVLFLVELKKSFPERVSYSDNELVIYSQWTAGKVVRQSYVEFTQESIATTKVNNSSPPKKRIRSSARISVPKETTAFFELAKSGLHDDALVYFKEYFGKNRRGFDWLNELPRYPGREHVPLDSLVMQWRKAMKAFLRYRKDQGYEDEKNVTASLNILADYLFLYLPWWKELYPDSPVSLPLAPKDFRRYAFFCRSADEPLALFPKTFREILKLRRASEDAEYAALKQIQLFFRFVESFFSEEVDVAGPDFRNPVFEEFDLPRVHKRTKTAKIVFPKGAYSYLVHYAYAVEAMGEYLLDKCLSNSNTRELRLISGKTWLDTEMLGFVPFVRVRGKTTPLRCVPNVFSWLTRTFKIGGVEVERFVPHLTLLRVLIAAIETGLRLSGLRWLDQRTWDQGNRGESDVHEFLFQPSGRYIYNLYVNTDKRKERPFVIGMVFRLRSLLLRENAFRSSINEPDMQMAVPYQGRQESRFGYIVPLFRASSSANPISAGLCYDYWVLFLTGFQEFYSGILGQRTFFVKITPILVDKENDEPKVIIFEDGTQYCPVSILAINTPHACRATYATNRQGLIETSDIAIQLGHESTATTTYYQSPRAEDLHEKLEAADRAIFDDAQRFERDAASYIRPEQQDSAMARSFMANRDAAMKQFKVMPAIALWNSAETESMSPEAIENLRNGPMSLVRFHPTHICPVGDECPADIVQSIGDFKRCGICPLALKGIDHLPAIAAKKNCLLERIRYQLKQRDALEKAGEIASADELWESIELDTNEWIGWQLSEEVLAKSYVDTMTQGEANDEEAILYHVEDPEIVRQHLQRVVRQSSEVEFLLCRIAESNAYPTMQTPQIQAVASAIKRRLLGSRDIRDFFAEIPGPADITLTASLLKTVMRANQLSLADVSKQLASQPALPTSRHLRIGESS